jgi:hypothetical protein
MDELVCIKCMARRPDSSSILSAALILRHNFWCNPRSSSFFCVQSALLIRPQKVPSSTFGLPVCCISLFSHLRICMQVLL